jgi:hypothetical protein
MHALALLLICVIGLSEAKIRAAAPHKHAKQSVVTQVAYVTETLTYYSAETSTVTIVIPTTVTEMATQVTSLTDTWVTTDSSTQVQTQTVSMLVPETTEDVAVTSIATDWFLIQVIDTPSTAITLTSTYSLYNIVISTATFYEDTTVQITSAVTQTQIVYETTTIGTITQIDLQTVTLTGTSYATDSEASTLTLTVEETLTLTAYETETVATELDTAVEIVTENVTSTLTQFDSTLLTESDTTTQTDTQYSTVTEWATLTITTTLDTTTVVQVTSIQIATVTSQWDENATITMTSTINTHEPTTISANGGDVCKVPDKSGRLLMVQASTSFDESDKTCAKYGLKRASLQLLSHASPESVYLCASYGQRFAWYDGSLENAALRNSTCLAYSISRNSSSRLGTVPCSNNYAALCQADGPLTVIITKSGLGSK